MLMERQRGWKVKFLRLLGSCSLLERTRPCWIRWTHALLNSAERADASKVIRRVTNTISLLETVWTFKNCNFPTRVTRFQKFPLQMIITYFAKQFRSRVAVAVFPIYRSVTDGGIYLWISKLQARLSYPDCKCSCKFIPLWTKVSFICQIKC